MIREKAKELLNLLKQGNGSATMFGSSYYDEETRKIIQIISNECKATIIKKDGTIKRHESDILLGDIEELVQHLLSDKNTIKNSLVQVLTANKENSIPGITIPIKIEKNINEEGLPYISINKPFPDNFCEIISGQINREELEKKVIKPYLARVCKEEKRFIKKTFLF